MRRSTLLLAILVCAASIAHADPDLTTASHGEWGVRGVTRSIAVEQNRVFAADGRGLAVYDSSSGSLNRIASYTSAARSIGVAASDDDVFLLTESALEWLRVSTAGFISRVHSTTLSGFTSIATNGEWTAAAGSEIYVWQRSGDLLRVVGHTVLESPVSSLAFHGNVVYAAVPGVGILVFDPAQGLREPIAVVGTSARSLTVSGNVLYVAAGTGGLVSYDISNDNAPRELGRAIRDGINFDRVALSGTIAAVTQGTDQTLLYDVSNPAAPRALSTITDPVSVIGAGGGELFLAGQIVDRYFYTKETGAQLRMYDLATPAMPRLAGEQRDADLAGPVSGVATDGRYAYVVDPPRFRVIDLTFPAAPREIASIVVPTIEDSVRISGTTAAVYGRHYVTLIDIAIPSAPRVIGGWDGLGRPESTAAFTRNKLLEGNPNSGFHVLDMTNPLKVIQVGGLKGHYNTLVARNDTAYVFDQGAGRVVDLSDPTSARIVRTLQGSATQAEIGEPSDTHPALLFVVAPDGLHILTLSDPLDPIEVALLPLPPQGFLAAGRNVAFYGAGEQLFQIDVSNPASPVITTTALHLFGPRQLSVSGDKLVIADTYSLQVFGSEPILKRRLIRK